MVRANYTQPSLVRNTGRPSGKPAGGTMPTPDQFRNQASIFSQARKPVMPGLNNGFRMYDLPRGRGNDPTKHFGEIIGKKYADGHIGGEHHRHNEGPRGHHEPSRGHHEGQNAGNPVLSFLDKVFGRKPEPKANPFGHQTRR